MNAKELVELMSREAGIAKARARSALEALMTAVTARLRESGKADIPSLVTFRVVRTPPRMGRNPRTGSSLTIPSRKGVRARFERGLCDQIALRDRMYEKEIGTLLDDLFVPGEQSPPNPSDDRILIRHRSRRPPQSGGADGA